MFSAPPKLKSPLMSNVPVILVLSCRLIVPVSLTKFKSPVLDCISSLAITKLPVSINAPSIVVVDAPVFTRRALN